MKAERQKCIFDNRQEVVYLLILDLETKWNWDFWQIQSNSLLARGLVPWVIHFPKSEGHGSTMTTIKPHFIDLNYSGPPQTALSCPLNAPGYMHFSLVSWVIAFPNPECHGSALVPIKATFDYPYSFWAPKTIFGPLKYQIAINTDNLSENWISVECFYAPKKYMVSWLQLKWGKNSQCQKRPYLFGKRASKL